MELNVVNVPQPANRGAAVQRKIDVVDANFLQATNETPLDVLIAVSQYLHLGTEEHVITVEVENVVGARSAALCANHVVNYDLHVLADAFHGHRVPVAIVDGNRLDAHRCRATAAVKPVLHEAIFQLHQQTTFKVMLQTLTNNQSVITESLSLSVLNGHFPGGPELAGTRMFPFWILLERS